VERKGVRARIKVSKSTVILIHWTMGHSKMLLAAMEYRGGLTAEWGATMTMTEAALLW
jgi:hypothetical protein